MATFYAQPYSICATGFYFNTLEQYQEKAANARDDYGQPVEEFEIQFIDGDAIDAAFCEAAGINQANMATVLEALDDLDDDDKRAIAIACDYCGYDFVTALNDPPEVDVYTCTMRELAEQIVDDGLFGEIPDAIAHYIDLDAIARDLTMDYGEAEIAGERIIYRCE